MEDNRNEITVEEMVRRVVNDLCQINVPIVLTRQIAEPIMQAAERLKMCLNAWENERVKDDAGTQA